MKNYAKFVLLCLMLTCLSAIGNAQISIISITCDYGDRQSVVFIGTDKMTVSKFRSKSTNRKPYMGTSGYVISGKCLSYLSQYVKMNCKTKRRTHGTHSQYFIKTYMKTKEDVCYYAEPDDIINYFNGMIQWLKKSKCHSSCQELIDQLELYVKVERNSR